MHLKMLSAKQKFGSATRSISQMFMLGIFLLSLTTEMTLAQTVPQGCGVLWSPGRFGPNDYRPEGYVPESTYKSHKALLAIVESAHFTPEVEALVSGKSNYIAGDISYTLHAFPNHHRALLSMIALGEKEHTDKPRFSSYSIECWLQRAIAFRPDDHIVRLIYAGYLIKVKREKDAAQQVDIAATQAGDNAFAHQNVGLVYFDMGKYDLALQHAHKAIELGLNRPELKEQLTKVGKWSEPGLTKPPDAAKSSP